MGEVTRDGILYPYFGQIVVNNASLQRQPSPYFTVRMKGLSQIGHDALIYGDELTEDSLGALQVPWGDSTAVRYSTLQANYSYTWDVGAGIFAVKDALHVITYYREIKSISDLGIPWNVLETHQFIIRLTASSDEDAFLISKKIDARNVSNYVSYNWGQGDPYVTGNAPFVSGAMGNIDGSVPGETAIGIHQNAELRIRQIFLSKALVLDTSGGYLNNMVIQENDYVALRSPIEHNGTNIDLGKLLMIHMFTCNKMVGSFPNSYPWMLFTVFKWLWDDDNSGQPYDPNGPGEARIYDRTFDLSPWWG